MTIPWDKLDNAGKIERLETMLKSLITRWRYFRANPDEFTAHDVLRISGRVARTQREIYKYTGEWRTT